VKEKGGLHVIATELHESARIDRQLYGRCGRQGDPGSAEAIVSFEDELVRLHLGPVMRTLKPGRLVEQGSLGKDMARKMFELAQQRAERANAAIRRDLLTLDDHLGDLLAFSGRGE
jgi:preprotein translocase subunit SecA